MSDYYSVESGTVIRVDGGELVVRIDRSGEDCGGCRSCAMKALCRGRDDGHMDLPVASDGAEHSVGDLVKVAYRVANPAVAAGIMFLPSLAGLFLGGFIGHGLQRGDMYFLAGCFIGLAAGVGVSCLLGRLKPLKPKTRLLRE